MTVREGVGPNRPREVLMKFGSVTIPDREVHGVKQLGLKR